jgi:hypothetical protein
MPADDRKMVPPVTAIVPVYNGEETVAAAIASVLDQDYPEIEVLAIDDGSRDGSIAVLEALASREARARWISQPANVGLARTLNRGLRESTAPYVLVLHQDCGLRGSDWIRRAVGLLSNEPAIGVAGRAFHDIDRMTPLERIFWVVRAHTGATRTRPVGDPKMTLFSENKCDLFRRPELLAVGGFDESFRTGGEDQLLALRLERSGQRLLAPSDLQFDLTLGSDRRLGRGLHKELRYGQQMRSVLRRTRGRAARRSPSGHLDPRLVHRAFGVGWVVASAALLALGLWLRSPTLLLGAVVPPVLRAAELTARGVQERPAYALRRRDVAVVAGLGVLMDLVYAVGLVTPDPRSPSWPPAGSPTAASGSSATSSTPGPGR